MTETFRSVVEVTTDGVHVVIEDPPPELGDSYWFSELLETPRMAQKDVLRFIVELRGWAEVEPKNGVSDLVQDLHLGQFLVVTCKHYC